MKASLRIAFASAALVALTTLPRAAAAGQSQRYGRYVVYYSAISTDLLTPEVANAYGYQRSSHKGLVNIAIKRDAGNGIEHAIAGRVGGSAVNLSGQRVPVDFQEVKEDDAIYYLGTFPISGSDTVRFDLTIAPSGDTPHKLVFSRDYVTD
ncbi:MAG: DUF4426 domain-containing protein [Rhodanobacteraceae bacterium]